MKNTLENPNMILFDKLPKDWRIQKLKRVTSFAYGNSLSDEEREVGNTPVFGSNGIVGFHNEPLTNAPCIIIGRKGSFGKVNYSNAPCYPIDTTFYINNSVTKNNLRWLYYVLIFLKLDSYSKDSAVPGLAREEAYENFVPLPPLSAQKAIANFLDKETSRIDSLISAKERFIGLLEEKRKATITEAVTRGLSPDVKMKDSGVEWLGKVPKHWEIERAKWLFTQSNLSVDEGDEIVTCFRNGRVTLRKNVREEGFTNGIIEFGYQGIVPGQLVLHSMDAFAGAIGVSDSAGKCSPEYIICNPKTKNIFNDYYAHLLRDMALKGYIQAFCSAVRERAPRIRFSDFSEIFLCVPPISEQKQIVDYIRKQTTRIDKLIQKTNESIELLKERRIALIGEAVTGKLRIGVKV